MNSFLEQNNITLSQEKRAILSGAKNYPSLKTQIQLISDFLFKNNKPLSYQQSNQLTHTLERAAKHAIIEQGALTPLTSHGWLPTVPAAIESAIYTGNHPNSGHLRGMAAKTYNHSIIRPLMEFMALAALGKHDRDVGEHRKKFNIIGAHGEKIDSVKYDGDYFGIYMQKHSVYVAMDNDPIKIWGVILHEAAHFAMYKVFKNDAYPYRHSDQASDERFNDIADKVLHDHKLFPWITKGSYRKRQYASELIVHVPEAIAEYGHDGHDWLKEHAPQLLEFYEDSVNPAIRHYLKEHEAEKYLMLPEKSKKPALVKPLQTTDYQERYHHDVQNSGMHGK